MKEDEEVEQQQREKKEEVEVDQLSSQFEKMLKHAPATKEKREVLKRTTRQTDKEWYITEHFFSQENTYRTLKTHRITLTGEHL